MAAVRIAGWIALSILSVTALAVAIVLLVPAASSGLLAYAVHSTTGYHLEVDELRLDLFPPRLTGEEIRLTNPAVLAAKPLLSVTRLEANADLGGYFADEPTWWDAAAAGAVVRVEDAGGGTTGWSRPASAETSSPESSTDASTTGSSQNNRQSALFGFASIQVTDLDFIRLAEGEARHVEVAELQLVKDDDERLRVKLDASYNDEPVSASGTLALPSSDKARDVDFQAMLFGNEMELNGTVGSDGIIPGEATFDVRLTNPLPLERLFDLDLKRFAPASLQGKLTAPEQGRWLLTASGTVAGSVLRLDSAATSDAPHYTLDELDLAIGESSVTARGTLNTKTRTLAGEATSRRLLIGPVTDFFGSDDSAGPQAASRPTTVPGWLGQWTLDLDVRLAEVLYQDYLARDLKLDLRSGSETLEITAQLDGLTAPPGRDVETGQATAPGRAADAEPAWQLVEPATAVLRLDTVRQDAPVGWPVAVQFETQGIRGSLDSVIPATASAPPAGQLQLLIENFSALDGFGAWRWDAYLPAGIDVRMQSRSSVLEMNPVVVTVGGSQIEGQISADMSSQPMSISGSLYSPEVDLENFATTSVERLEDSGERLDADSGDLISEEPINWDFLEAARLDLSLMMDRLQFNQTAFLDVEAVVLLDDGELTIDPFDANLSAGKVRGFARVERLPSGARVAGRLLVAGLTPADLGQKNEGLIDGGETDLLLDLRGSGNTPQELAASLDGELALEVQRATIRNNLFEMIGSDILLETINLINPFAKKDDTTELECAALYFKAKDGKLVSQEQLVIETGKVKIRGGGTVNLRDETLQIDFVPTPREGLGISVASLASVVRLGGTLGNPQPEADPGGIVKAGATIGAAIATGGLSLLGQGLFDRLRSAGTACGQIFEKLPGDSGESAEAESSP